MKPLLLVFVLFSGSVLSQELNASEGKEHSWFNPWALFFATLIIYHMIHQNAFGHFGSQRTKKNEQ
jgi:hypothetical protein